MKKIEKLNITTKMLLVLIYAFILLTIAVFIINFADARVEARDYGTEARDQYIKVLTKVVETRNASDLTKENSKETAAWYIYSHIIQTTDKQVKNIELFVSAETMDGNTIYFEETSKSSSSYKGTPCTNATHFKGYTSGMNKQNNYSSSSKTYTKTNNELKMVYIDILYDVVLSEAETVAKELKYYFVPVNPETEDFSKYEEDITLIANTATTLNVQELNEYLTVKLQYTPTTDAETDTTKKEVFAIWLEANEDKYAEVGKYVVNSKVTLFAKGKNDPSDTENYFSDYIKITDNQGVYLDKGNSYITDTVKNSVTNAYRSSRDIPVSYEVNELYLLLSVTLNTGEKTQVKLKINVQR